VLVPSLLHSEERPTRLLLSFDDSRQPDDDDDDGTNEERTVCGLEQCASMNVLMLGCVELDNVSLFRMSSPKHQVVI